MNLLLKPKSALLVLILALSAWALRPPPQHSPLGGTHQTHPSEDGTEQIVIKIAPGIYLPGLMPMNVGAPLEGFRKVADEFESLYPDTRIEFVGVPGAAIREWLVTQLSSGLAPDILNVNVEDVWQDIQKGWYIPLDEYLEKPNPFAEPGAPGSERWWDAFKYQSISRGKAAPDGKMYCISLDMVETGVFYNKDIFAKCSIAPPNDWIEFLDILSRLKDEGYIPMLLFVNNIADWGFDLIFDQLYYSLLSGIDLKQDPDREQYLQGYLDWDEIGFLHKKGFFTKRDPRFVEAWRIIKEWRQYLSKDLTSLDDFIRPFITEKAAMLWDPCWTVNRLSRDPDIRFDWGVFYLPPIPPEYSPYATGHPMCVIGGAATQLSVTNSAISDTGEVATSERLKRCIAFLQFLTTPTNTDVVVNEICCFLPNVRGADPHEELLPFHDFLQRRYTTTKWAYTFDLRFAEITLRMLELYLNDGIDLEGYLDWMEKNLDSAVSTIARRKNVDFQQLEQRWRELAPVRAAMTGLPDHAR